jgi:catechol 2,3-dioxygenase-like lactoylglutathione lyase family enzyme
MEKRVSVITLGVRDLARSRRFYESGLGWGRDSGAPGTQAGPLRIGATPC